MDAEPKPDEPIIVPLVSMQCESREDFDAALESHKRALERMVPEVEALSPMLFVATKKLMVGPFPMNSVLKKDWDGFLMFSLKEMDAVGYMLVVEGYAVKQELDEHGNVPELGCKPSEHPDARDVAMITWAYEREEGLVQRDISKTREFEGDWRATGDTDGRLTRLLPGARGN